MYVDATRGAPGIGARRMPSQTRPRHLRKKKHRTSPLCFRFFLASSSSRCNAQPIGSSGQWNLITATSTSPETVLSTLLRIKIWCCNFVKYVIWSTSASQQTSLSVVYTKLCIHQWERLAPLPSSPPPQSVRFPARQRPPARAAVLVGRGQAQPRQPPPTSAPHLCTCGEGPACQPQGLRLQLNTRRSRTKPPPSILLACAQFEDGRGLDRG